jgi:hypothetical protein
VAPFTVTPRPGIITAIVRQKATTSAIGVKARMTASPCREAACMTTRPIRPNIT